MKNYTLRGTALLASLLVWASGGSSLTAQTTESSNVLEGSTKNYIVVFRENVIDDDTVTKDISTKEQLEVSERYKHIFKGFSAKLSEKKLTKLKQDPRVEFISEDRPVYATATKQQPGNQAVQTIPTGINRIGAVNKANKGSGIGVAVIDTGIDLTHPDLKANVYPVNKTCVSGTRNANDDNGHGTHVAGTIAGINNSVGVVGVAPQAKLVAVKVLNKNGSGTWSSVICGIDWVAANAVSLGIKVVNMSLGGTGSSDNNCGNTNNDALHKAICNAVSKGVTFVVAAGNNSSNSANSVPASYDDAVITVSALADSNGVSGGTGSSTPYGPDDTFATFSNYGSAVDIAAPGVNIYSTWKGGTYNTISGTSMATPHVAGGVALYIKSNPGSTWTQIRDALKALGEPLGSGHTDPSSLHPEPVVKANSL